MKIATRKILTNFIAIVVASLFVTTVVLAAINVYMSLEGEGGSLTGAVSAVADTSASSGNAVKFGPAESADGCPVAMRTITAQNVANLTNSGYPDGTKVYTPGGPDPWGGCFPNESNTGIPAGTTLTNYTGPCTIVQDATIDSKNINCSLYINAGNVTITNSKITAGNIWINGGTLMFSDNEADFGNNPDDEGLKGSNFTVLRSNLYGGKRQVWCINACVLQDSYLHDQLADPSGQTHESAVRVEQSTTLQHNTLLCNAPNIPPNAGCSANQTGYADFATIHSNTMNKNLYMATAGGYCSYGGATTASYSNDPQNATNIRFTNNVFQRGTSPNDRDTIPATDKRRYTCGSYGATTGFNSSKAGFSFEGNMWDDGLLLADDSTYPYPGFY